MYIFRVVVCVIVLELALKSWYHPRIVVQVGMKLPDNKFYYWTVLKCWKLKITNKKVCDKKRVTWNWKFSRLQNPDIHLWRLQWGRRPLLQVAGTFQISCEETQSLRNFEQMINIFCGENLKFRFWVSLCLCRSIYICPCILLCLCLCLCVCLFLYICPCIQLFLCPLPGEKPLLCIGVVSVQLKKCKNDDNSI